jgi:hypothetical protein
VACGTPACTCKLQLSNVKPTQVSTASAAKFFQQHWRHLKGNYELNSAIEKADRLLEQKRTGCQVHYIAPLTL